jgi:hypothetical protein
MDNKAAGCLRVSQCFGQAAVVIPVSVAQDHKISSSDIDAELPGVMQKHLIASAEVIEYAQSLARFSDLQPYGQSLLTP